MSNRLTKEMVEEALAERIKAYLADAPMDGRHSDAVGANAYELLAEARAALQARPDWKEAEQALSAAYVRLRAMIPGAFDTPHAPTREQVWETTERALTAALTRPAADRMKGEQMNYSVDWDGPGERDREMCQCTKCGRMHWHLGTPPGLKARGIGRVADNEQAIILYFDRRLTDDEMRELHDTAGLLDA